MWDRAVAPKIQIPFVVGRIEMMSAYVFLQHFEPLFALAAAYDFADSRHEQIHCCHSLPVIVQTHIEWFDLLRIIENGDRAFEVFLRQPPFVFRLQAQSSRTRWRAAKCSSFRHGTSDQRCKL